MKKILVASLTLVIVFLLGSCATRIAPIHLTIKKDTGYMAYTPVTRARFTCSGKKLQNPALIGTDSVWKDIVVAADTTLFVSHETAKNISRSRYHGFWFWGPLFRDIILGALALILLILVIWFLVYLIMRLAELLDRPRRVVHQLVEEPARTIVVTRPEVAGATPAPAQNLPTMTIHRGADGEIDISIF